MAANRFDSIWECCCGVNDVPRKGIHDLRRLSAAKPIGLAEAAGAKGELLGSRVHAATAEGTLEQLEVAETEAAGAAGEGELLGCGVHGSVAEGTLEPLKVAEAEAAGAVGELPGSRVHAALEGA